MSKAVKFIVGAALVVAGAVTGNFTLVAAGISLAGSALQTPKAPKTDRSGQAEALQLGEVSRQAIVGRAAERGSLVDAFNYGGEYGTDWTVLVIALADHRCDALEGFDVNDDFVAFAGDGAVPGYNGQLEVYWRSGTWDQTVPAILTSYGPGWTANDRGRGVAHVVVAYKADDADAKNPVWAGRRPNFKFVVRGMRCYDSRFDSSVGGSGAQRRDDPATWVWGENPIVCRYNWVRGIYAGDRIDQPEMLLIGRGLSAIEAPPENVFARANLCDELVGGEPRYRIGGLINADEPFIEVENDIAAACAGIIVQREGAVEIDPGEARAPVAHFTDADLLVGGKVQWSDFLGQADPEWVNSVVATFNDPDQQWKQRSAPIHREISDIQADGRPREERLVLPLSNWRAQSERVAEVRRRFGRLWGRGSLILPPRFAAIEEGDWVTWQSNRYFEGATLTFRVEAWGSNPAWHHSLTLRQISASVYSDTDPLDDGAIAYQPPAPPDIAPPAVGAWTLTAALLVGGGVESPALVVTGNSNDPSARFVRFEYIQSDTLPGPEAAWIDAGVSGPDVKRREFIVSADRIYYAAVSNAVDGVQGDRRILGPVTTSNLSIDFGNIVGTEQLLDDINSAIALAASRGKVWTGATIPSVAESNVGDTWIAPNGVFYDRVPAGGILLAGKAIVLAGYRPRIAWTRSVNQPLEATIATANVASVTADAAAGRIAAYDDDDILDVSEKRRLILDDAQLEGAYQEIILSAAALGVSSAALTASRTAYRAFRDAIAPAWNDTSQDSPVTRNSLDAVVNGFSSSIAALRKDIEAKAATLASWSAVADDDGNRPEDGATRNKAKGNYVGGTEYIPGDSIVWTVASGGTGHNYTRIGTGSTTGVAPSDGSKWALTVERGQTGSTGPTGSQGPQGVAGTPGADGTPRYNWIAYADSADGLTNFTNGAPGTRTHIGIASNKTSPTESSDAADYTWSKFVGDDGATGPQGLQGDQGIQGPAGTQGDTGATGAAGAQGAPGADGQTLYTWIAYAENATGTSGFTTGTNTGQAYIGIANNKTTATEGTNPADYTWSLIKGDQGVAGTPGADGTPTYTWFAYADSADGLTNFTTGAPGTRTYLGIAANKTTATESTNAADYTWSKIQGPQGLQGDDGPGGPQGVQGIPGTDGTDGIDGTDGKVIEFVWKRAATQPAAPSGNGIPAGWTDEPVAGSDPLWMSTVKQELDGTLVSGESWSTPIRHDGPKGDTGNTGATGSQGPQGIQGPNGADGTPRYIWIAYADNATGSVNFTNGAPGSRKYIGIASNKIVSTESTDAADYNWSLITGADGQDGATGPQGAQGVAGVDGVDGTDGKLTEFVFQRSIAPPATPTGNGIPAGWYDDIPAGELPLWMSRAKQELDGTLIGVWDAPIRWSEDDQLLIVATLAAADALNPKVGQRAMTPDGMIYRRVSSTGILLGTTVVTLGGFRPSIKWTAEAEQPVVAAAKTASIDKDGLIISYEGGPTPVDNRLQKWVDVDGPDIPDDNADVTQTAQITIDPVAPFEIQADASGATLTALPQARTIKVRKGGALLTSGVAFSQLSATAGLAITVGASSGQVDLDTANASGAVIVNCVYNGVTYQAAILVNRVKAAPITGGTAGSVQFIDDIWTNISTASDVQVTDIDALVQSNASGELRYSASASYDGSGTAIIKAQYSTDGSTWSDFAAESTGLAALSGGEPSPGYVAIAPATKTGLTASTDYYVRLIARRSSGTGSLSWFGAGFTVKQP